ncbi:MAG: preprotein translocase subunit SecG [Phycisphaerae bacterium]|jgi:preprotein translocase subunit SecG
MLLAATTFHFILAFFFAVVAILLMIVILLQRGKGVGLAGAFGGAGGATAAFGAKTGDFLTWVTIIGAGVLLVFAILLNFVFVQGPPDLGNNAANTPAPPPGQTPPAGGSGLLIDPTAAPDYAMLDIFGDGAA